MKIDSSNALQILLLMGGLSLIPAILFTVTGFTRILIVLGFIRSAIGHHDHAAQPGAGRNRAVPDAVRDVADDQRDQEGRLGAAAASPDLDGDAIKRGEEPLREFMFRQTRDQDISLFVSLARIKTPADAR